MEGLVILGGLHNLSTDKIRLTISPDVLSPQGSNNIGGQTRTENMAGPVDQIDYS